MLTGQGIRDNWWALSGFSGEVGHPEAYTLSCPHAPAGFLHPFIRQESCMSHSGGLIARNRQPPLHPFLKDSEVDYIIKVVNSYDRYR